MEPYIIKRGNRWAKHAVLPLAAIAIFVLLHYDVLEDASAAIGVIPLVFAFEPRSWAFSEDGSISYTAKKTLIVFRPAPLEEIQRKKGTLHLIYRTGRVLDMPIAGLKKREKDAMYQHMAKSLVL